MIANQRIGFTNGRMEFIFSIIIIGFIYFDTFGDFYFDVFIVCLSVNVNWEDGWVIL